MTRGTLVCLFHQTTRLAIVFMGEVTMFSYDNKNQMKKAEIAKE